MDRDWLIIFVVGLAWGSTFFFNEMLLRDFGPLTVSLTRVFLAAVTCWLYLAASGTSPVVESRHYPALAVMGLLMFAAPFAIYPLGQQYVASGVAGIVNALTPVFTVIVSHLWPGGERATPMKMIGVVFGFLGIVLLTVPALRSGEETRLFGTLVLVLAPLCYALAFNWVRRFGAMRMSVVATWAFSFAALVLCPVVLAVEGVPQGLRPSNLLSAGIVGVGLTGIAFLVAFEILPRAGATKTSTVTFIAPISALFIGWFVLNEALGTLHFAGMAAIFLGLLMIDGRLLSMRRGTP